MHFYERTPLKGNVLTSNIEDARGGLLLAIPPPPPPPGGRGGGGGPPPPFPPPPPFRGDEDSSAALPFKMATDAMRLFSPSAACGSGAVASAHSERPRTQLTDSYTRGIIQGTGGKRITLPAVEDSTVAGETLRLENSVRRYTTKYTERGIIPYCHHPEVLRERGLSFEL